MTEPRTLTQQELAQAFAEPGVAAAYEHRPPYPTAVFDILESLIVDEPRAVLDIGAGEGAIARPLAARVARVDALDISAAMIEAGRLRPGGEQPNLRWLVGAIETADLDGPYALVTAGASLHWMQWEQTFAQLREVLAPQGQLAIIEHGPRNVPWQHELIEVIKSHSRNPGYDPRFSLPEALHEQGLFELGGSIDTSPVIFRQPVADYVEQFHSRATLAREHMSDDEAEEFAHSVETAVRPWVVEESLDLTIVATITWGRPLAR